MKHKEELKRPDLPIASHVKTLLKMKKERMSSSGLRPLEATAPAQLTNSRSTLPPRASNADLASVGIKSRKTGEKDIEDYFDKNYVKQARMREEDKVEYKQIKNDQVKAVRGEIETLEKRHLRDQARVKKNFEMMDELLQDLKKWRQEKAVEESTIVAKKSEQPKEDQTKDQSDLYLTELQAMKEEQEAEREAFQNKYTEATKSWKAPNKLQSVKLMENAKQVVLIRQKFTEKQNDFQKLKEIHEFKLKGEIKQLEGKNEFLDKQLQILNKTEREDEALLSQIDDITLHMKEWEKEISATLEGLTLLEQDQKLKVPKIPEGEEEEDEQESSLKQDGLSTANKVKGLLDGILNEKESKPMKEEKGGITITDPAVQAMLADIESEFESVERLMKD